MVDAKYRRLDKYLKHMESGKMRDMLEQFLADSGRASDEAMAEEEACNNGVCPGNEILLLGNICEAAKELICTFYETELLKRFSPHFLRQSVVYNDYRIDNSELEQINGVKLVLPVLEGGIYRSLYQLWKETDTGFTIEYAAVSVEQLVIELCELFDLDPFGLLSGKCSLVVTDSAIDIIKLAKERGISCSVIGEMIPGKDKLIYHRENVSRVNRPMRDEIFKVL